MSSAWRRAALRRVVTVALPAALISALVLGILFFIRPQILPTIQAATDRLIRLALSRPPTIRPALEREARAVLAAGSVEYRYEFVFPYDFFPGGTADWRTLARLDDQARRGVELSPQELDYLSAYRLAEEIGITPKRLPPASVVVTLIADAGFSPSRFSGSSWLTSQGWTAIVHLPDPAISRVKAIGSGREEQAASVPDLPAGELRKVILFVSERARARLTRAGILVDARERGRQLLRALLRDRGFSDVRFIDSERGADDR